MPTKYLRIVDIKRSDLQFDETKVDLTRGFANPVPTDENGEVSYSDEGRYRYSPEIMFPNVKIGGLSSLFSFEEHSGYHIDEDGNNEGSIVYQLSNNNGSSWLFWNGLIWTTPVLPSDWNSETNIQLGISTFPFIIGGNKQIRIKAKLIPNSTGLKAPYLYGVSIHHELEFTPEEDVIRSLVNKLDNELRVITELSVELGVASTSFVPDLLNEIDSVIGVWNTSVDPGRLNNIFTALNKTLIETKETGEKVFTQTISFSSQIAGSVIVARIKLKFPIYIAPDADYILSDIPKITIEIQDFSEDSDFRNDGHKIEKNKALMIAKIRKHPTAYRMPIRLLSYSPDELLTKEMNRALIRVLDNSNILSLATAEEMSITNETDFARANVIREDLSVKIYSCSILFHDWDGEYREVPLVETFQTIVDKGGPA